MNKCLIISMFSKQESSYAEYYKEMLKERGVSYDILYLSVTWINMIGWIMKLSTRNIVLPAEAR